MMKTTRQTLAFFAVVLGHFFLCPSANGDAVKRELNFSTKVNLKTPNMYTFRFSLWDASADGSLLWSEEKQIKLKGKILSHRLGSVDPEDNGLLSDFFSMQVWVQVEMKKKNTWKQLGQRTPLYPASHALSAQSVIDGGVTTESIASGTITSAHIKNGAVTDNKIGGTISASKIDATIARSTDVTSHSSNTANPHQVTAAQVGAAASNHNHNSSYVDYTKTSILSPGATAAGNGTALLAAISAIADASADNPYLIKLEPGVYDLGASTLTMKDFVDIEGSGEGVTIIKGPSVAAANSGTVVGANAELRSLTIESTNGDGGNYAIALYIGSSKSTRAIHVTLRGSNSENNYGSYIASSNAYLESVSAYGAGGVDSYGIFITGSSPRLKNVYAKGSQGTDDSFGVHILSTDTSPDIDGLTAIGEGYNQAASSAYGIYANGCNNCVFKNVTMIGSGSNRNRGIYVNGSNPLTLQNVYTAGDATGYSDGLASDSAGIRVSNTTGTISNSIAIGKNGTSSYGFASGAPSGGTIQIMNSSLTGATSTISNTSGTTVKVAASQLSGGAVGGSGAGAVSCIATFDENSASPAYSGCP